MRHYSTYRTFISMALAAVGILSLSGLASAATTAAAMPPAARHVVEEGYQRKAAGDLQGAVICFQKARAWGANAQQMAIEIGYLHTSQGSVGDARSQFAAAAQGPDPVLAEQAQRELAVMPGRFSADLYADSYGWHRAAGGNVSTDLVPTVRVRAFLRPSFALDLHFYLYAQATRDTASRGRDSVGVASVYADDYALAGGGVLLRLAERHLGLFAQAGPAFNLLDDGRPRLAVDARVGAFLGLETPGCRPDRQGPAFRATFCSDLYSEAVYASRFAHNVIGFARGHLGLGYLVTGPLSWQLLLEGRSSGDCNADYYNNFADAGLVQRWRLLGGPLPFDISAGLHGGRYLGRSGVDPAPAELRYLDLRILAATQLEF